MEVVEFDRGLCSNFSHIINPAVTKVEEWTSLEMGVGAAMAAGSHETNGVWALLVAIVISNIIIIIGWKVIDLMFVTMRMVTLAINVMSPIRLVNIVIIDP